MKPFCVHACGGCNRKRYMCPNFEQAGKTPSTTTGVLILLVVAAIIWGMGACNLRRIPVGGKDERHAQN